MLSENAADSKVSVYEKTRLQEAWGDRIDPAEFIRDQGDSFGATVYNAYTSLYDRTDGRYRPVYQHEMDLRRVRAMAWFIYETVPTAAAWANRLLDYTIGTGFDWQIKPANPDNKPLANAVKAWVDRVLENSKWSSGLERESFLREVVDGEFLASIETSMGSTALLCHESDELTEPANAHALEEWLEVDFVPSWSFGVLSRRNRNAQHLGYHLVHDEVGTDWDFYRPNQFEFWKRNSRANAKRGFSDFHRAFLHIARSDLVLTNTAEGAANQAAIAYIVEHSDKASAPDIDRFAQANSYMSHSVDPITRQLDRKKRLKSGTRLDVRGAKFHAGLLGSNNSNVYIEVMDAALRIAGTVHAFPEGMLTGSYANNNFASSLTAESPFVQGRMADQASRAQNKKQMLRKIITVGFQLGVFRAFHVPDIETLLSELEVLVIPSRIVHRDPLQLTQALIAQENQGYVSRLTAMNELGRDPEVEIAQGAKPKEEGGPGGAPGGSAGPGGPGGGPGPEGGPSPDPTKPPASWANLSRMQLVRNMRAYKDVIAGLKAKEMSSNEARAMLAQIGFDASNIDLILRDMRDGKQDLPLREGRRRVNLEECEDDPKCGCKSKHARLIASRYRKYLKRLKRRRVREAFDPSQPRAKDGKWIDSGVNYSHWAPNNSAAQSAIKAIKAMEQLAAKGKWAELEMVPVVPDITKPGLNSYQKGKWHAKNNLLKLKTVDHVPKGAVPVPDSPAVKGWTKVGEQLGTEIGGTYLGPDGKKYYVKTPKDEARAHNEVLASKLYQAAGSAVVSADLVDVNGTKGVATLWAEDAKKINWNDPAARAAAHEDFAVHAWLANWDAVGAGSENPMDNIKMIDGKPTLVDAGGSLEYKGMGGSGMKPFYSSVEEIATFKNASINPTMAKVFSDMTPSELLKSYDKVLSVKPEEIKSLVSKYYLGDADEKAAFAKRLLQRQEDIAGKRALLKKELFFENLEANGVEDTVELPNPLYKGPAPEPEKIPPKPAVAPMGLPKPPFTTSKANASVNGKFAGLYNLAAQGSLADLEAFPTNPNAKQTYTKKIHKYKMDLIAAVKAGAVSSSAPVAPVAAPVVAGAAPSKPKAAPKPAAKITVDPAAFSLAVPTFASSNQAQVAANQQQIQTINDLAKLGDWDTLAKAKDGFKSPKVLAYAEAVEGLKEKLAGGGGASLVQSLNKVKSAPASDKVGYWVKTKVDPSAIAGMKVGKLDSTKLDPLQEAHWIIGENKYKNYKTNPLGKTTLKAYTGGQYASVNSTLRQGASNAETIAMTKAFKDLQQELPAGIVISRTHAKKGNLTLEGLQSLVGSVVADDGFLSTSAGQVVFGGNPVHWKIKVNAGTKGAMVRNYSNHSNENEIVLPPKQKLFLRAAFMGKYAGNSVIEVHAETVPE